MMNHPIIIEVLNHKFTVNFEQTAGKFCSKDRFQTATICILRCSSPIKLYAGAALCKPYDLESDQGKHIAFKRAVRSWALDNVPELCSNGEYSNLEQMFRFALWFVVSGKAQEEKDWKEQHVDERPV
jgi:hypothetical protein